MAELILTEEEKAIPFWNGLDDAALGRAVKYFGLRLQLENLPPETQEEYDMQNLMMKAAIIGFCNFIQQCGASEYTGTLTGLHDQHGNPTGEWEITYKRRIPSTKRRRHEKH